MSDHWKNGEERRNLERILLKEKIKLLISTRLFIDNKRQQESGFAVLEYLKEQLKKYE